MNMRDKKGGDNGYMCKTKFYVEYFQALEVILDFSIIDSFANFGCNDGHLLEAVKEKRPAIDTDNFDHNVLSKPFSFGKQYALVNCSCVEQYISYADENDFLDNLSKVASDILILTWSNKNKNTDEQRLNHRSENYIISKLEKKGFSHWEELSLKLKNILADKSDETCCQSCAENILIFKKNKFAHIDSSYFIQNISTDNDSHKQNLQKAGLCRKSLQELFIKITDIVNQKVAKKEGASILRASDGDYFFLRQIAIGSAKPGKRALTVPYDKIDMQLFRNMFWQNDIITLNLEKHEHKDWMKFIIIDFIEKIVSKVIYRPVKPIQNARLAYAIDKILTPLTWFGIIPMLIVYIYSSQKKKVYLEKAKSIINNEVIPSETIYGLVSTKWIFRNFRNEIGIIASKNKVALIKELMKSEKYRKHLGIELFTDYFTVPEKGAANDVLYLSKTLGEKIKKSKAKIFLVGAGSSKIALIPLLCRYSDAVFIDVGAGIDAIAGIICQNRPYFAEWTNYRIKNYDYSKIDFMDQENPAWNKKEYKTIYLD